MTRILEPRTCSTPARRRTLPAAPVLIRLPALSHATIGNGSGPIRRRRRLRREFRIAGCWLLALIPTAVVGASWGGGRAPVLLAVHAPAQAPEAGAGLADESRPCISLSIAPVLAVQPAEAVECSVFLSGQLLPADAPEEVVHGGY